MFTRQKRVPNVDFILVITLFLPIFAEQFSSVFLTLVSTLISSNIDTNIINVTSLVSSVISLPSAIYSAVASGGAILMSHAMGAGDTPRARRLFTTSMHLGLVIASFISLAIILTSSPLLHAVYPAMSEEFFAAGEIYAVFAALCFPINFYQTNTIGIMRSCLNTKGAFLISLSVSVVDLLMRALFMIVFDFKILGLCFAIIISKLFSLAVCSFIIKKIGLFKGCITDFKNFISRDAFRSILSYGAVMCGETFFLSCGGVILNKILADMGDLQVTGANIAVSMESLLTVVPNSLALVAQLVAGRYKGAGENRHALVLSMRITLVAMALHFVAALISFPVAEQYARCYTNDDDVIAVTLAVYKLYIFTMPFVWAFGNSLSAGIRGYGNVRQPALTIIICMWAFKIPATYYFCEVLGGGAVAKTAVNIAETGIYAISFLSYYFIELSRIKKRELIKNN